MICAFWIIIFAHIGLGYIVIFIIHSFIIHAFIDDFWDFPTKFLPRYLISGRQKISYFCILLFQGPSRPQFDQAFLQCQYFTTSSNWRCGSTRGEPRGPNRHGWQRLPGRLRHEVPFARWASSCLRLLMYAFVLTENGCPIFPIIFWGGSGGRTLLPPLEGMICCCRWREITAIVTTDASLA
jgi:hypothetical protein